MSTVRVPCTGPTAEGRRTSGSGTAGADATAADPLAAGPAVTASAVTGPVDADRAAAGPLAAGPAVSASAAVDGAAGPAASASAVTGPVDADRAAAGPLAAGPAASAPLAADPAVTVSAVTASAVTASAVTGPVDAGPVDADRAAAGPLAAGPAASASAAVDGAAGPAASASVAGGPAVTASAAVDGAAGPVASASAFAGPVAAGGSGLCTPGSGLGGLDGGGAGVGGSGAGGLDVAVAVAAARREGEACEERRALTPGVAGAVARAGFPRYFVPGRWGGGAGTFSGLVRDGALLAECSASVAWCAVLYAAHGRLASYLPREGQRELWCGGPDVRIAASVVPAQGTAVAEGDGWRLSGRWGYASGVDHAQWVLLASLTGEGEERCHRVFAVPRAEVEVADTWRVLGLRGTGSNTVRAEGVFVPAYRTMTLQDLLRPQGDAARCHQVPYPMVAGLLFATPALGAARAALGQWLRTVAGKRRPGGRTVGEAAGGQQAFARSAADVQAAEHLLFAAARRADQGEVTAVAVAENQRDAAAAADLCRQAVTRLFQTSGAAGLADSDPLQRCWRDVTAVASHAALDLEVQMAAYAQVVLARTGQGAA